MSTRFVLVSEQYFPQETATGYLLTALAESLARYLDVSVLCTFPPTGARHNSIPPCERRHEVSIYRCTSTRLNKDVLLFRIINLISASLSLFWQLVRRLRGKDIVLVVTNPPLLPYLAVLACRLRKASCILLIYDVYPEVLSATGVLRRDSPFYGWLDRLNRRLYRSVDRIVVLGRDMERLVSTKLEDSGPRVTIIPNWADLENIIPAEPAENGLLKELGLADKFVVQYAGNMGRPNEIESLVECAKILREKEDIHFLFIGTGAKRPWLERAVAEHGLTNVTVLPVRPRSDQANFLNACHVAMVPLVSGMTGLAVPSRTYNILAAGKPILAIVNDDSEVALVVREERVGWVVPPTRPAKIAEAILDAKAHPECLAEIRVRSRAAAEGKYSLSRVIRSYLDIVEELHLAPQASATQWSKQILNSTQH